MATDLTAGLPPDAVTKAAAVHAGWHGRKPQGGDRNVAEVMLAAAAPAIRAQERERIRQLASLVSASYFAGTDEHGPDIRQFANLIGEGDERIQSRRAS
jgi:hypothetical protein